MEPLSQPTPSLGVCYYPEHWPESTWAEDAQRMRDTGLTWVRIGEFAWKELEPQPGTMNWSWLDRAFETLVDAGLKVVLGTPTATPPKWLVDRMPDMLPIGRDGRPRGFGSRRHYDFSHPGYRAEAARIAAAMAERYGRHPGLAAWQIDNEYGCHDTIRTAGPIARAGFQQYLEEKYGTTAALNEAWWNQFWSLSVDRFDEIELPIAAVTNANPSAILDYYRFASAAAVAFHKVQVDEIRPRSPGRPITHNAMIFFADLDSHALGRELHERLGVALDHLRRMGSSLDGAVGHYNRFVGSLEGRVLVSARRLADHGVSDVALPDVVAVTQRTRQPAPVGEPGGVP
jgi:beta-galactosidase